MVVADAGPPAEAPGAENEGCWGVALETVSDNPSLLVVLLFLPDGAALFDVEVEVSAAPPILEVPPFLLPFEVVVEGALSPPGIVGIIMGCPPVGDPGACIWLAAEAPSISP